jgi:hypothetical protein
VLLRLGGAFGALVAGVAAVIVVALLANDLPPITSAATTSTPAGSQTTTTAAGTNPVGTIAKSANGFPVPPPGAVVLGAKAGIPPKTKANPTPLNDTLGLAVVPGSGRVGLQASVIDENGDPVSNLAVRFAVTAAGGGTKQAAGAACGKGCYRATVAIGTPRRVVVSLAPLKPRDVTFTLPAQWPPRPAAPIVTHADKVWRALRTLAFNDVLSAGGAYTQKTNWKVVAPDRVAYSVVGLGGSSIIIGDKRWDKPSGPGPWQESPQDPVTQPIPFWVSQANAHVLGTVVVRGHPAWKISFFDPDTPGWFTILVDKATGHTMEVDMTAAAHFMHDTYGGFNAPISIEPPKNVKK